MIKIPYTEEKFNKEYFFYSGNSHPFTKATLLREFPTYDQNLNNIRSFLSPEYGSRLASEFERVFGKPSFEDDYVGNLFYIFKFNNDTFYFQIDVHDEGNTFGILTDDNYKEKYPNYMFHPMEYNWQKSLLISNKFINFMTELYNQLQ